MTLTTPVRDYAILVSESCAQFNRPGEGNIAHRVVDGTHKHIDGCAVRPATGVWTEGT